MIEPIGFYIEHSRYFNFAFFVLVVIGMTASSIARRTKMIRRTRRVWFWIYLIMLNFLYATATNIDDNIRVNPPVVIAGLLGLGMFLSMVYHPADDNELPPHDASLSTRFVKWLDRVVVTRKERSGTR